MRELGGDVLAEQNAARLARDRDARRVPCRAVAAVDARAVFGRHVSGLDDVFDAERNALQHVASRAPVVLPREHERPFDIEVLPRLDLRLTRLDALSARGDERRTRELALHDP